MVQALQFRGSPSGKAVQVTFDLPEPKPDEVLIKVTLSGLCGSDLYFLDQDRVLGHEGVGIVQTVGSACTRLHMGDRVGWGATGATCGQCDMCLAGRDNYCTDPQMYGINSPDTMGSVCSHVVRKEQWIFKIPDAVSSEDAAPLMCGGCTVWEPLIKECKPYHRVGIVALGGLGHFAVQFAAKMGCEVVVFSSTDDKRDEALALGAHEFYATKGVKDYSTLGLKRKIDCFLITASSVYDVSLLYPILAQNGKIVPLSLGPGNLSAPSMETFMHGYHIVGSCMCNRYLQTKMLDFAATHAIHSTNEVYPMSVEGIMEAAEKLRAGRMRYRGILVWEKN